MGVVVATQNLVDLDYKGLSNAGTWFIGRLQTERDKARVLDGLEGASTAAGAAFDRQQMDQILSGLGKRVFLMNNVHENQPVVFQSRWALSFLRGPLSREQIQTLMASKKNATKLQAAAAAAPPTAAPAAAAALKTVPAAASASPAAAPDAARRPVLPPEIPEFFLPLRKSLPAGTALCYRPTLVGTARVHFAQSKSNVDVWENVVLTALVGDALTASIWDDAEAGTDEAPELEKA